MTLFVGIPALMIVSAVWRRLQADFPKYRAYDRARTKFRLALAEWKRTQREWWQALRGKALEAEVARLFARRGFAVRHVGGAGDEGVDLLLTSGERTILVQCKGHKKPIGPAVVREVYGTLAHHKHGEAWLVAVCGFTRAAVEFARGKPIRLLGVDQLIAELQRADGRGAGPNGR